MRIEQHQPEAAPVYIPKVRQKFTMTLAGLTADVPNGFPDHGVLFSIPTRDLVDDVRAFDEEATGPCFSIDAVAVILSPVDALQIGKALVEAYGSYETDD